MEARIEGIQGELQEGMGIMKSELQRDLLEMKEKFELMMRKWDGNKWERKEKGIAKNLSDLKWWWSNAS